MEKVLRVEDGKYVGIDVIDADKCIMSNGESVEDAINSLAGNDIIESNGGSETYTVKLTSLLNQLDRTKVTANSYIEMTGPTYGFILRISRKRTDLAVYTMVRAYTAQNPIEIIEVAFTSNTVEAYEVLGSNFINIGSTTIDGKLVLHY